MRLNSGHLSFFIREFAFAVKREAGSKRLGALIYFKMMLVAPLLESIAFLLAPSKVGDASRRWLSVMRRDAVRDVYGVYLDFDVQYPPDMIWGDYDKEPSFLPSFGSAVLDVGANIGDYSIVVARYYGCRVLSIEPSPSAFALLLKNIASNGLPDRVHPLNLALSDTEGEKEMSISERWGYVIDSELEGNSVNVRTTTLDALFDGDRFMQIQLVKVDVEGSELAVLRGGKSYFATHKPKLIIEVHSNELRQSIMDFMLSLNYNLIREKLNFPSLGISVLYFIHAGR